VHVTGSVYSRTCETFFITVLHLKNLGGKFCAITTCGCCMFIGLHFLITTQAALCAPCLDCKQIVHWPATCVQFQSAK
jgi:hypothetical protein